MPTRQYEGPSIDALLTKVRREVGTEAKIVKAQKVRRGGIFGFFARELFQLIVEVPHGAKGAAPAKSTGSGLGRTASRRPSRSAQPPTHVKTVPARDSSYEIVPGMEPDIADEGGSSAMPSHPRGDVNDLVRRRYGMAGGLGSPAGGETAPTGRFTRGAGITRRGSPRSPADRTPGEFEDAVTDAGGLVSDLIESTGVETAAETGVLEAVEVLMTQGPGTGMLGGDATASPRSGEVSPFWASFLPPPPGALSTKASGSPARSPAGAGIDISHPIPSTERAAFFGLIASLTGSTGDGIPTATRDGVRATETRSRGADQFQSPSRPRGGALEPAPLPDSTDYLDDVEAAGAGEIAAMGEAPTLPPDLLEALTRMPVAGFLPPDQPGRLVPSFPSWSAAFAGQSGAIFAPSPFMPSGLSEIGFPAALLPFKGTSELAAKLADPETEVDLDSRELARDLFVEALGELPPKPDMPTGAGRILAFVGALSESRSVAERLAAEQGVDPAEVVVAAPDGAARGVPAWMAIPSADVAAKRRPRWRDKTQLTLVAVAAPLSAADRLWAREVLEALQPDLVCGVVESTHKPEDIASWALDIGRVDSLALEGGRTTRTPAAIFACGIPVSFIDGKPADMDLWTKIVEDRLMGNGEVRSVTIAQNGIDRPAMEPGVDGELTTGQVAEPVAAST